MNKISEIKVSYHLKSNVRDKITSSEKAFEILLNFWDKGTIELQEDFKILLLNEANEVLAFTLYLKANCPEGKLHQHINSFISSNFIFGNMN